MPNGSCTAFINQLNILTMTLTPPPVCPGFAERSTSQQLARCKQHMKTLLTGMEAAIKSVTRLRLHVQYVFSGTKLLYDPSTHPASTCMLENANSLSAVANVTCDVCHMLAAAVPSLQRLTLMGRCVNVALDAFAARCLRLNSLEVEVVAVSFAGMHMHGLDVLLPRITHFTLKNYANSREDDVDEYVSDVLQYLKEWSILTTLQLDLKSPNQKVDEHHSYMHGSSKRLLTVWDVLPPTITDLRCDVHLPGLSSGDCIDRVQFLTLTSLPVDSKYLAEFLLENAPCLEKLTITGSDDVGLFWDTNNLSHALVSRLKTRLLRGFQLCCPAVICGGPSKTIRKVMTWFAPLQDTTSCVICLQDEVHFTNFFPKIAIIFPSVVNLEVDNQLNASVLFDEEVLTSLDKCKFLQTLDIRTLIQFSTPGLINLCMSLPALRSIKLSPCAGLCSASTEQELAARGRHITISEVS